jgi:MarR family 2-MHQ and catechol resistance regulon transcriptional repressor
MSWNTPITAPKLWIVLARCHRAMAQLVEHGIAEAGLCMSDFMVLEVLLHKGPLTISQIQDKVLLASGSMTAAIDRVEKKGLLVRKPTENDRRAWSLELTEEGERTAQTAFATHAEELKAVMSVLTEEEAQALYGPLKRLGLFAAETLARRKADGSAKGKRSKKEKRQ